MISSGLEYRPKLYVVDDAQPNAFATGRNPEHSVICVTTALLERLDYYEIEGVLAHELSHISNYDIRLSAVITVMVGLVVMLSDMFTRSFIYRERDNDRESNGNAIIMVVGLICLILSPIFAKLLQLAVSRRREYLADVTAVQFTRNPEGLISALEKIPLFDSVFIVIPAKISNIIIVITNATNVIPLTSLIFFICYLLYFFIILYYK